MFSGWQHFTTTACLLCRSLLHGSFALPLKTDTTFLKHCWPLCYSGQCLCCFSFPDLLWLLYSEMCPWASPTGTRAELRFSAQSCRLFGAQGHSMRAFVGTQVWHEMQITKLLNHSWRSMFSICTKVPSHAPKELWLPPGDNFFSFTGRFQKG